MLQTVYGTLRVRHSWTMLQTVYGTFLVTVQGT
jgi:hypothetical protein